MLKIITYNKLNKTEIYKIKTNKINNKKEIFNKKRKERERDERKRKRIIKTSN